MAWTRYANLTTGLEVITKTGKVFWPRSFCDDETIGPVGIYIAKEPVCKLKLSPTTQFPGTDIAWDISQSLSATGTIDSFNIEWGGATDIGDLTSQDWASDPKTGNVQYDDVGTYTVEAYVEDLLGKRSKVARVTVEIVEADVTDKIWIGTTDGGCYLLTSSSLTQKNTGLTGNHINFRSLRLNPHSRDLDDHQLWAATQDGVVYTTDDADNWNLISKATLEEPVNTAEDDPVPETDDLDQIDVTFDPQNPDRVYLLRTTATRAWLYYSDDNGTTWNNNQVAA
jgi:ligand-binding sensor domain-containing protein